ncbi:MAG: molybdopterin-dependent oxidoreductase [Lachnospiraceae bacterium]|nr:molybdopterin-dependent oxidoreductase [Lachnospiraceae bacterium]
MRTVQKAVCPYDCPGTCGLLVETENNKILKVKGDPEHPLHHGLICEKMQGYEKAVNSPERITTPLKRVGAKGEGRFEPISWEQALTEITDRWKQILKEDGPDAVIGLSSSGTQGWIQKSIVDCLFNKMGARQMIMTLCNGAKGAAVDSLMGGRGCLCGTELKDSDYYIVWGCNMKATRLHTLALLNQQRKKGKKVLLIEVCAVDNGKYCDEVLLIRPGSDGALALAMMQVITEAGLAADGFMKEFASGWEEFRATLPQYTPEWAQEITGIPAEVIRRVALEIGHAKAPAIVGGTGPCRRKNGGMNIRLSIILSAITGGWANPGGGYLGENPRSGPVLNRALIHRPDLRTHFGEKANINLLSEILADTTPSEKVKAFYVSGGNPVNAIHNQKKMEEALLREDLFTVVHEQFHTDTTSYADYVLPATFSVEHTDVYTPASFCHISTGLKAVDAPGEAKSNWETICLLAQYMGYTDEQFSLTAEEMLERLLSQPLEPLCNMDPAAVETLRRGGTVALPYSDHLHFPTPDGKFRIIDETLEEPMPRYIPDFDDPYPLALTAIPGTLSLNSVFAARRDLMERRGAMILYLNPEDAAERAIVTGDRVLVKNDLAEVEFTGVVTELMAKGSVGAPGVYSKKDAGQRLLMNALTHSRLSDMGEGTAMNGNYVEVEKLRERN